MFHIKKLIVFFLFTLVSVPYSYTQESITDSIYQIQLEAFDYTQKGLYPQAEKLCLDILEKEKKIHGTEHANYATALMNYANLVSQQGNYARGDSLYEKAIKIREKVFGKTSLEYAEALHDRSFYLIYMQRISGLENSLKHVINIRKKELGEKDILYSTAINSLGNLYSLTSRFEEAKKLLQEAADIRLKECGENSQEYINSVFSLGNYHFYKGEYQKAKEFYQKGIKICDVVLGEDHVEYMGPLLVMSTIHGALSEYKESEQYLLKAKELIETHFNSSNPQYPGILSNLGSIYYKLGRYTEAEQYLKKSISLSEKMYGKKHTMYFNAINILSAVYLAMGYYEKAEPLALESLNLRKALFGESHTSIANALNNLSNLYIEMGNMDDAEKALLEAIKIETDNFNKESSKLVIFLSNLALIYRYRDPVGSLELYKEAAEVQKELAGEDDPDYIILLSNIAQGIQYNIKSGLLPKNEKYNGKSIEELLIYIVNEYKDSGSENNMKFLKSLNNLIYYYCTNREYNKASEFLAYQNKTLESGTDIYENTTNYIFLLINMGTYYEIIGEYSNAASIYTQAFSIMKKQMEKNIAFLSEKEREIFWNSIKEQINIIVSFAYKNKEIVPECADLIYNSILFSKGLLLNSSLQIQKSIIESENKELVENWGNIKEFNSQLDKLNHLLSKLEKDFINGLSVDSFQEAKDIMSRSGDKDGIALLEQIDEMKNTYINLEYEVRLLEKKIASESALFGKQQKDFILDWNDVKKVLKKNQLIIEFVDFVDFDIISLSASSRKYGAILLGPEFQNPVLIDLCDEDKIIEAFKSSKYDAKHVYPLIWKPIEKYLDNVNEIFIAPSGLLHSVSFQGMKINDKYLGDKYLIHNILSSKDLISFEEGEMKGKKKAALFGGADYGLPYDEFIANENDYISSNLTRSILDELSPTRGQGFRYLHGSRKEVEIIQKQLSVLGWSADFYIDKDATESRFKSYSSNSPTLLHISTHGFYFPPENENKKSLDLEQSKNIYKISDNPLMRSGLAFTGANHIWNGKEPNDNIEDGILTAYEVSSMDLTNTELVVLSACETGLGDISSSEGVYGLQRAFRLAGVKSMIVSLWAVPDKETTYLMTEFYSLWNNSNTKDAFNKAQQKLKTKYPDEPYKWAGFILIE